MVRNAGNRGVAHAEDAAEAMVAVEAVEAVLAVGEEKVEDAPVSVLVQMWRERRRRFPRRWQGCQRRR